MEGVDPMTAVAEGAALAAGILTGEIKDFDFFVATEHALGTVVHDALNKPHFSVLISRNTKLPASDTRFFSPVFDDQEVVRVRVIEGDPDREFEHEDNVILKEWDVALLEKRPVAQAGFSISFEYDVDGILNVLVVDEKTRTVMMKEQVAFGVARTKQELVDIRRRIDNTAVVDDARSQEAVPVLPRPGSGLCEESRASVRKAKEKIFPFVDDPTQSLLNDQIAALLRAGPEGEPAAREQLERTIRDNAYLL